MELMEKRSKLLGLMFLLVVLTSLSSNMILQSITETGSILSVLSNINDNLMLTRISILIEMFTSVGIIALATLLYHVLKEQNRLMASIALGWWSAEAIILAVSKLGTFALLSLSRKIAISGNLDNSFVQFFSEFLYFDFDRQGNALHMLFYNMGGLFWYYLFFKSMYIPRFISLFGLIAVSVSLIGFILFFLGFNIPMYVSLPILPFELTIGFWLLFKGINLKHQTRLI